jgi:hypothetical protein
MHARQSADYLLVVSQEGRQPHSGDASARLHGVRRRRGCRPSCPYRNWTGDQKQNRFSHWIWQRYAAACWEDVRLERVLPFEEAEDDQDEKHPHPLQLDVIDRALALWTNPGERVCRRSPALGSEVYGAVSAGRFGVGIDIKPSYYRQMVKNLASIETAPKQEQVDLFALAGVAV